MKRLRHTSVDITTRLYITNNPLLNRVQHEETVRKINGNNRQLQVSGGCSGSVQVMDQTADSPVNIMMNEAEAIRAVRKIGITYKALREYAIENGQAEEKGRGYLYAGSFIADLKNNYFTKEEAMQLTNLKRSGFFYWIKGRGVEPILIGKASLFRKDNFLAHILKKPNTPARSS